MDDDKDREIADLKAVIAALRELIKDDPSTTSIA